MKVVIVGAGGIGQHLAQQLGVRGHQVVLGSRSGRGIGSAVASSPSPLVQAVSVDASDPVAMRGLVEGSDALVNAVNPPYTKWAEQWPPMAQSFLGAARDSGAALLVVSNLYGYGLVNQPITESQPQVPNGTKSRIRAQMWQEALAEHRAGRIKVAEIRPSDYFGPGAGDAVSYLNRFAIGPALRGRVARHVRGVMGAPHSWSYVKDIAALSVAVLEADPEGGDWGRPWHVPSAAPKSLNEVAEDVARVAGALPRKPKLLPRSARWGLRALPLMRELDETAHQFERPFVLDASQAEGRFGLIATPWDVALTETIEWLQNRAR